MVLTSLLLSCVLAQTPKPTIVDLKVGAGAVAARGDVVNLGFRATFLNGQILDSTFGKAPLCIKLGWRPRLEGFTRVAFPALDEAIAGMKVGGSRRITLPSELAYGALEVGEVPPNTALTFEVQLLDVIPKGAQGKLKIEEMSVGTGAEPTDGKPVRVHYRGSFVNGVQFESTVQSADPQGRPAGTPLTFVYGPKAMVSGFIAGLKGMKVGGWRRVTIPYNFAYGELGKEQIPPFATLVFELYLESVG